VYQLKNSRSVLDRYQSRRSSDGRKDMVGVRVSPEVRERLETIAEQEVDVVKHDHEGGVGQVAREVVLELGSVVAAADIGACQRGRKLGEDLVLGVVLGAGEHACVGIHRGVSKGGPRHQGFAAAVAPVQVEV